MIAPTTQTRPKIGRNTACPCGSKKKYKFCCGAKEGTLPKPSKILSPKGFQQCFMILVERAGGKVNVSCDDLEALVKDGSKALGIKHDADTDSFNFEMIKIKVSPIIQPGSRLQIVDDSGEDKEEGDDS
jgi:hypothetical protein